jgi:hypothetical protein
VIGSEPSRTTGASSNELPAEKLLQYRNQLVHRDTSIAATNNMTQVEHLKAVGKTEQSKNMMQHAICAE